MRLRTIILAATIALLTAAMGAALHERASHLVTTLIAIPLGSIIGAIAGMKLFDRHERRRAERQADAEFPLRSAPPLAIPGEVVQFRLPAPRRPGREAA